MASLNPDQPNILFILSDDQGAWAMGCAGNSELSTPNLDRLAATGVRFENFFCASPVCSPARASILTGQIPSQHGVQDFLRKGNSEFVQKDGMEINYMEGRTSYVQELSRNGYVCGLSGKWHLGNARLPQLGFDYWNVHAAGGGGRAAHGGAGRNAFEGGVGGGQRRDVDARGAARKRRRGPRLG